MLHSIKNEDKELIVVGDRVLICPDHPNEKNDMGLYLPQTVAEKEKVQSGRVVAVGPGVPIADPGPDEDEPWRQGRERTRYVPMQAHEGDHAIFMRKAAVEIKFDGVDYLVVPQGAILLLLREPD
jgi:co-chaperonin GroES (HSP10)